jgi:hypothetical protein
MFAGGFLDDHIGHEIVNMYKDDHGRNYVYIQPYGTYQTSHHGKIGAVLMVRSVPGKSALEVLGLATGLTDIFNPALGYKKQWKVHTKYILDNNITYGGVPLLDIFDRSKEKEEDQPVYFTMQAEHVVRPNRKVYIIYGNTRTIVEEGAEIVMLPNTNQAKCSLKQYFDPKSKDYGELKALLDSKNLWTEDTYSLVGYGRTMEVHEDNFFDILGVADYELAFSNALAYYMEKYPELVIEFAKQYFGKKVKAFRVFREWGNIDLLLENDEQIVVIENKITSKINGIQVKDGQRVGSQLDDYLRKATARANGHKVSCFILTPDYNPINLDEYNTDGFICKEHYKQLFYSEVYSFLEGRYPNDIYFQEFLKGMKKHTQLYHNDLFADTKAKFVKQIKMQIK